MNADVRIIFDFSTKDCATPTFLDLAEATDSHLATETLTEPILDFRFWIGDEPILY